MLNTDRMFNILVFGILLVHLSDALPANTPAKPITENGCTILYKTDFSEKEPIIFKDFDTYAPKDSGIFLKPNEEINLACPGNSNKITGLTKDVVKAKCVQGKILNIDGAQKDFTKITCDKRVSGQYKETFTPCGNRGVKKFLGHKLGDKFSPIIYVCYDQKRGESLFAVDIVHGSAIDFAKDGKTDPNFKVAGLDFRVKPEQTYTQASLKKIFTKLLGSEKTADQYINAKSILVKAQLSPKEDFVFTSSQHTPYFFINTVPQWQIINTGNWKSVENIIRQSASASKDNFKIISGGYDVLALKDQNGKDVKLYLDDLNTLPVPKYVWKIVYSLNTKKAVAFVSLNNPFVKSVPANEELCPNICDKVTTVNAAWKDPSKGMIYCCDVKKLMEKVKTIPSLGEISGVLELKSTAAPKQVITPKGCILNVKTDFPEKEPILLKKATQNYELIKPQNEGVLLATNQEISILCSGSNNKISKLNKKLVTATCVSGKSLKIEGKTFNFNDLGCALRVPSEFKLTKTECINQGLVKQIGYKIDDNNFVSWIDVCYDHKQGEALYSKHILYGSAINNAKMVSQNIDYKIGGLELRVNVDDAYKIENQKKIFENLLESKNLATKYISTNSFLARAHLAPVADFIFGPSKYTSYFYLNTVPQWQVINNGNWKSVENAVRATASVTKEDFLTMTGGYGTLTLKNAKGNDVEIYLDVLKTLPVPKFIWKLIQSKQTSKGIVFISLNNPFVETISKNDYICPNICKNHGWGSPEWEKKEKGLVYCCDIKEFEKIVTIDKIDMYKGVQEARKK